MTPRSAVAVHCYVRASSLVEPVDATVERLREFDRGGVIDELRVEAWPDDVPLEGESQHSNVIQRFEAFRAWADRLGASIRPAFTVRERTTLVADETRTVLVLPVVCLSIHVDGELASVVPHVEGDTTYTVEDALVDLEALEYATVSPVTRSATDGPPGPSPEGRTWEQCPACGEGLASGQGLYACSSCSWVGVDPADVGTTIRAGDPSRDPDSHDPESAESERHRTRGRDERPPHPPT